MPAWSAPCSTTSSIKGSTSSTTSTSGPGSGSTCTTTVALRCGPRSSIDIGVQAEMATPGADYAPLMNVAGLPCWPDQPQWSQLDDAAWFQSVGADFENPTAQVMTHETSLTLAVGTDYDQVVVAI